MDDITKTLTNALDLVWDKVGGWLKALIVMLPNLLVAVLLVVAFYFVAKGVRSLVTRGLGHVTQNRQVVQLIGTIARLGVMVAGLFVALGILNLDKTVTSLLAGVGIIGLALGFAFQDLAANFISGIIMSVRNQFTIGDLVEVDGVFGFVDTTDLRATRIRKPSGEMVTIPNRKVLDNSIINFNTSGERRVEVEIGVAYGDDVGAAAKLLRSTLDGLSVRKDGKPVEAFATGFGDSSMNLVGRFWIAETGQAKWLAARSDAIIAVKSAFDDAGLTIPFPIRTLDFGVVGGERLDDMMTGMGWGDGPGQSTSKDKSGATTASPSDTTSKSTAVS